jgi:hypothetical protein
MPGVWVLQRGKNLRHDRNGNKVPGKRHARYRNPAMSDQTLQQITPAKEKELLYRTTKKDEKGKRQCELILFPLSPDVDHPEQ